MCKDQFIRIIETGYQRTIFDDTMLHLRKCNGLKISEESFCCAVSLHYRLAVKETLTIEELYGENLLLMRWGVE